MPPPLNLDTMEEDFGAYLLGHNKIRNVVSDRIYADVANQDTEYPYAVVSWVGEDGSHHLSGAGEMVRERLQIDLYAKTTDSRTATFKAFRAALDGVVQKTFGNTKFSSITLQNRIDGMEQVEDGTEQGDFRRTLLFDVWYSRAVPGLP